MTNAELKSLVADKKATRAQLEEGLESLFLPPENYCNKPKARAAISAALVVEELMTVVQHDFELADLVKVSALSDALLAVVMSTSRDEATLLECRGLAKAAGLPVSGISKVGLLKSAERTLRGLQDDNKYEVFADLVERQVAYAQAADDKRQAEDEVEALPEAVTPQTTDERQKALDACMAQIHAERAAKAAPWRVQPYKMTVAELEKQILLRAAGVLDNDFNAVFYAVSKEPVNVLVSPNGQQFRLGRNRDAAAAVAREILADPTSRTIARAVLTKETIGAKHATVVRQNIMVAARGAAIERHPHNLRKVGEAMKEIEETLTGEVADALGIHVG